MLGPHEAPVAEPFVVQDIFVSGLLRVENAGPGTSRFVLYVNQMSSCGEMERVIVCRIIMSTEAAREASRQTLVATNEPLRLCSECPKQSCH